MKNFTVVFGTNLIFEMNGKEKQLSFFTNEEGNSKEEVEFTIEQKILNYPFIKDAAGYCRRTNTVVSYQVKENGIEFKETTTKGDK